MPYSITTKDGIKINNIPDEIDPSSAQLRERVSQLRAERSQGVPSQTVMGARSQALTGQQPEQIDSGSRLTQQMRDLPELSDVGVSGITGGGAKAAALSPVLLATTDPKEIADIITKNFPETSVVYNKDARGDTYPILVNNESGQATIINRPGLTGMDIIQGLGLATAFTPASALRSIPAVAAGSAATEAAMQTGQAAAGGDFSLPDVAMAGALGGAFKGGEEVLSGGLRSAQGSAKSQLVREGEAAGVPLMTSDVLPPKTFASKSLRETGEKIPVIGTGEVRAAQNKMRIDAVDQVAKKYGEYSYDAIVQSLKGQKDKIKKAAGSVLSKTGDKLDSFGTSVPYVNTQDAISIAKRELDKPGAITSGAAKEDIQTLINALDTAPNFTTLKELRTAFREIVEGTDRAERSQMTSRVKALLGNVEKGLGKDMSSFARQNLTPEEFSKWQKANQVYRDEAIDLTKTRLKTILDKGDVTPEVAQNMLFSKKPSEIAKLKDSLSESGRKNAKSAIISKVVQDATKPSSGMTPNTFSASMERYSPQIKTFFKGEELKQLEGLKRVLQATSRAQDAAVTTPTGQGVIIGGLGLSAMTQPLETALVAGSISGLTRLYESAPVRNALLRLASVPQRSNAYDVALREAVEAIEAGSQSLRSLEQEQLLEQ